ncbi:hydroxylamine reductase [Maridesulfovibrio ferrireducens]|uniref:hydroxylamine reductase n=1 Tax=Maridesulfovibrio ferrireducens TaxID=246191 RepID=UPI001A1C08A1|nr:hydroxylamine reductase [Maridesulfovibrio ferrireducens]MBI9112472.1 hydroxylamine reductase [Maridesulfovibrio ferrireducens]
MFCNQCEQTAKGTGCTVKGVCGKTDETSAIQDLLIHVLAELGTVAVAAREEGIEIPSAVNLLTAEAVFSTLTNVNFDDERFIPIVKNVAAARDELAGKLKGGCSCGGVTKVGATAAELSKQGEAFSVNSFDENPDLRSLKQILIYGLKGVAAYVDHAAILGQQDPAVYAFLHEALAASLKPLGMEELVGLCMKCGEVNLRAMELLDAGNTGTYGHPVPTEVPLGAKAGKAILVSGHDLKDLRAILEQTEGTGINVYTHGEMLPCHGYPELKKFSHFYGHYGTAWQNQLKEFAEFPGSILMTTNCIQKPSEKYIGDIYTTGLVGWPGVTHVLNGDFSEVIAKAKELPGFPADTDKGTVLCGFARNAVLGVADKVIDAVKAGDIRHFFLVGGCDGAKPGRNYYTEFVEKAPEDTIILTLACGKFRFFDKKLGDIGGIPRLLDIGQCNDAYSAVQIAVALAGAFECGVNELPLSFILSWYEQKAVSILLTLLHLGIKDIRIGPSLPAFITPNVLNFLVENFNIMPISTPDEDLKAILG